VNLVNIQAVHPHKNKITIIKKEIGAISTTIPTIMKEDTTIEIIIEKLILEAEAEEEGQTVTHLIMEEEGEEEDIIIMIEDSIMIEKKEEKEEGVSEEEETEEGEEIEAEEVTEEEEVDSGTEIMEMIAIMGEETITAIITTIAKDIQITIITITDRMIHTRVTLHFIKVTTEVITIKTITSNLKTITIFYSSHLQLTQITIWNID
jgi:hypothetical protein